MHRSDDWRCDNDGNPGYNNRPGHYDSSTDDYASTNDNPSTNDHRGSDNNRPNHHDSLANNRWADDNGVFHRAIRFGTVRFR